jgi:hypothetical protein
MKRISTLTKQTDKFGTGKHGFRAATAPGVAPTDLEPDWFDHQQEEIANAIELPGFTIDPTSYRQLADTLRDITQDSQFAQTLGGGYQTITAPGAYGAIATEQVDPQIDGVPCDVLVAVGTNVCYLSEDNGISWVDAESGTATYVGVAIGRTDPTVPGWVALAVGNGGAWRGLNRGLSASVPLTAPQSNAGTADSGTPNFTRVVFDKYNSDDTNLYFWVCASAGLYKAQMSTGFATANFTKVSSDATADVCVMPGGRVVAYQTIGGVRHLSYTDDMGATALVSGASLATYATANPQLVYDEDSASVVFSDGASTTPKLARSTDGGVTIVDSQAYSADSVIRIFECRGRTLIWKQSWNAGGGQTPINTVHLRRVRAWSYSTHDIAAYRSINTEFNFSGGFQSGRARWVLRDSPDAKLGNLVPRW